MAENTIIAEASADCAWAVLADPDTYAVWVVGSREIFDWEGEWPDPGSLFHHTQGAGPFTLVRDETEVLEVEPGRRILLEARIRPWLIAHVEVVLDPLSARSTRIRVIERPVGGYLRPLSPIVDRAILARNAEAVERLKVLSEQRQRGRWAALEAGVGRVVGPAR